MENIQTIKTDVPYRGPGNTIRYTEVEFKVSEENNRYTATAIGADRDKRLTDLPSQITFENRDNKWRLLGKGEEEVMMSIVNKLKRLKA